MSDPGRLRKVAECLSGWKRTLLDLSRRNRLVDLHAGRGFRLESREAPEECAELPPERPARIGRLLRIAAPEPCALYGLLARDRRRLRFARARRLTVDDVEFGAVEEKKIDVVPGEVSVDPEPTDLEGLRALYRSLDKLRRGTKTIFEEQGVHTLFVALGTLEWRESDASSETLRSPLVLVPVVLEREGSEYALRPHEDSPEVNTALAYRLQHDFGIRVPELEEDRDEEDGRDDLRAFLDKLQEILRPGWGLEEEAWLSQFNFHKLPMYRDLEGEEVEARAASHPVVSALCGFPAERVEEALDAERLEEEQACPQLFPVLDADSSQMEVLELARRGRTLAVQGPPGTGKSQTIVNLIAQALREGKTVLFVSEKRAALEVVYRRLERLGLHRVCLDLHSHEASRKAVVEELIRTLGYLRERRSAPQSREFEEHRKLRAELQSYFQELCRKRGASGLSAYDAHGALAKLRSVPLVPLEIGPEVLESGRDGERDLVLRLEEIASAGIWGEEDRHPWGHVRAVPTGIIAPGETEAGFSQLAGAAGELVRIGEEVRSFLGADARDPASLPRVSSALERLAGGPLNPLRKEWLELEDGRLKSLAERAKSLEEERKESERLEKFLKDCGVPKELDLELVRGLAARLRYLQGRFWLRRFLGRRRVRKAFSSAAGVRLSTKAAEYAIFAFEKLSSMAPALAESRAALAKELGVPEAADLGAIARTLARLASLAALLGGKIPAELRDALGTLEPVRAAARAGQLARALEAAERRYREALEDGRIAPILRAGDYRAAEAPFAELSARAAGWAREAGRLHEWLRHLRALEDAERAGLGRFLAECRKRGVGRETLVKAFRRAYLTEWLKRAYSQAPVLERFDASRTEDLRQRFARLDKALQREAVEHTLASVAERVRAPLPANEETRLFREAAKKTRHLPLRKLFPQIPGVLTALKPCLMMSPLSVAAYLPRELFTFDLVLIDEASQLRPGDAIGALLRAKQAVIFGDEKQLPPTDFFMAQVEGQEEEAEEAEEAEAFESVLGLAQASFPSPMLRWHYRSRDERLVAFSNRRFYDGRLITFPSPEGDGAATGVSFVHVPEGAFESGGSRVNREEARRVVELVLDQARREPERTLGVIAMNIEQRDLIEELLARALREQPDLRIPERPGEPFFVKNLETVQGDERDVIILSVGYGPSEPGGVPALRFGPLNRQGGERRLNVAVTRARYRMVTVASFLPERLAGRETRWEGPRVLWEYMEYARLGGKERSLGGSGEPESEFEEAVRDALLARGYEVDCQVGVSGYRIDLAVRDGGGARYSVGIECDGSAYHSARTARDRDRIRQEVLEGLGWRILRVWSTDWLRDPERSIEKLIESIERARSDPANEAQGSSPVPGPSEVPASAPPEEVRSPSPIGVELTERPRPLSFQPYARYRGAGPWYPGGILGAPREAIEIVAKAVVQAESPVHRKQVEERVIEAFGHERRGKRIDAAARRAISSAVRRGWIVQEGEFLWVPGGERKAVPRSPGDLRREPEEIAPEEWLAAVVEALRVLGATSRKDLSKSVAQALLGYERVTEKVRELFEGAVDRALEKGLARELEGYLSLVDT